MKFKNITERKKLRLAIGVILIIAIFLSGIFIGTFIKSENGPVPQEIEKTEIQNVTPEELGIQNLVIELKDSGIIIGGKTDFSDFIRWLNGVKKAMSLLPPDARKNITFTYPDIIVPPNPNLIIRFIEDNQICCSGLYDYSRNKIEINLTPDINDHPYPFEPLALNGFGDEEILYLFLHEMAHAWYHNLKTPSDSYKKSVEGEPSPSLYGYFYESKEGKLEKTEIIDIVEDFAESFAFYVILPKYLKGDFPLRYYWLKDNVFGGTEYASVYESVPSSIKSLLTRLVIQIQKDD